MPLQDPKVVAFLELEEQNHGSDHRRICEELIQALPDESNFIPFNISSRASLQAQEVALQDLAAMNATPFDSRRD